MERLNLESSIYWIGLVGTVAFTISAVLTVVPKGTNLWSASVFGLITAIGGGLIRDVLAGRQTLLMGRELYSIPVLLGCTLYVALLELLPAFRLHGAVVCCLCIFGLRASAIHWNLTVPDWLTMKPKAG